MKLICIYLRYFLIVLCIAIGVCGAKAQEGVEFPYPQIPVMMTEPQQRATYLLLHYWDNVDFKDMKLVANDDFMEQGFVNYLSVLPIVDAQTAEQSVETMMKCAEVNVVAYKKFVGLAEKYLFEPNSPMVNDETYIMFLLQILNTNVLSKSEKSQFEHHYKVVMKNRVGSVATDFRYIDSAGKSGSLHSLKAEKTLLLFYDPECDHCDEIVGKLQKDPLLNRRIAEGKMKVLAVYADGNIDLWKKDLPSMPKNWTIVRDISRIQPLGLYILRAMPAIYLLDANKKVIKKELVPENLWE